ncbi:MAG TPA: NADH-quinone oxidoreductase subunit C [Acidobacteriota bacterium]|nr:NADH-quinone oxidoreductase subunit C [Acidobacteriota bacterium]
MAETNLIESIRAKVSKDVLGFHSYLGDDTILIRRESIFPVLKLLKEEYGFDMLADLSAVDYLGQEPRFEVVYHLNSLQKNIRLRVKSPVTEGEEVDSVVSLWSIANWLEREVWDMFGIKFKNHPDLRRLLMYEEFEGHPLRKDYPINKRQPRVKPIWKGIR